MALFDTLSTAQKRLIVSMQTARDTRSACKDAGIPERTAWRWLASPAFRSALTRAQDDALAQVTRVAVAKMGAALDVLASIADDTDAPAGARVQAARAILESALRFAEAVTLAERVTILEGMR